MSKSEIQVILLALCLFTACTQRTEPPPASRDGIAGGTNTPPKQESHAPGDQGKRGAETLPPDDVFMEKYKLGDNQFTVLVASFPAEPQAKELSYLLRMNRVSNFIDHVGGEWMVCIGKYGSRNGAKRTLELLHKRGAVRLLQQSGFGEPTVYGPGHPY